MTDTKALAVWREKLAGVTPGEATEAALRLIAGAFHRTDKKPRFSIPRRPDDDDALIMDFIEQSARDHRLSRILADEATVEGLARLMARDARIAKNAKYDGMPAWKLFERRARACLNHLAQLALGDGG